MTINVPEQVGAVLQELAERLGVAVEYIWTVILKQQWITGVCLCGTGALIVVFILACIGMAGRMTRIEAKAESAGEPIRRNAAGAAAGGWLIAAVLSIFPLGFFAYYGLRMLLNPGFYALNYILGLVR